MTLREAYEKALNGTHESDEAELAFWREWGPKIAGIGDDPRPT